MKWKLNISIRPWAFSKLCSFVVNPHIVKLGVLSEVVVGRGEWGQVSLRVYFNLSFLPSNGSGDGSHPRTPLYSTWWCWGPPNVSQQYFYWQCPGAAHSCLGHFPTHASWTTSKGCQDRSKETLSLHPDSLWDVISDFRNRQLQGRYGPRSSLLPGHCCWIAWCNGWESECGFQWSGCCIFKTHWLCLSPRGR